MQNYIITLYSCTWFVDGCHFMAAVADAIESAKEDIMIADWWLSPEIYMKRPVFDGNTWRLDTILQRKAVCFRLYTCIYNYNVKFHSTNNFQFSPAASGLCRFYYLNYLNSNTVPFQYASHLVQ